MVITRRSLFGLTAGAAASAVAPVRAEPLRPAIEWMGVRHVDMSREQLMDVVESLDHFISNRMWELEVNVRFDDPLPDAMLG